MELIHGDVLKDLPNDRFDTIVLSNFLEHIEDRVGFLQYCQKKINPIRYLIRVPIFTRDWRVPLMQELGVDYRLDVTHCIEYTKELFIEELALAGLKISFIDVQWGEIWAEANSYCHV